ncbi:hypothetical protein ACOTCR_18875 [Achromobacter xylosoxidans]
MCSHYQSLKDTELPLQKFGAPNEPAGGKYDMCRAAGGYQVPPGRRGKRMIVILPENAYGEWPTAPADATRLFSALPG